MPESYVLSLIVFIDCLPDEDAGIARRLWEDVCDHLCNNFGFPSDQVRRVRVSSKRDFFKVFEKLSREISAAKINAIVHIDCHGDTQTGLQFPSRECMSWNDAFNVVKLLNVSMRNNLIVNLGICDGVELACATETFDRAPFRYALMPRCRVEAQEVVSEVMALLSGLFETSEVASGLNEARENCKKYVLIDSEEVFYFSVTENYRDFYRRRDVDARAFELGLKAHLHRGINLREATVSARRLLDYNRQHMKELYETIFSRWVMHDLYPGNRRVFPFRHARFRRAIMDAEKR